MFLSQVDSFSIRTSSKFCFSLLWKFQFQDGPILAHSISFEFQTTAFATFQKIKKSIFEYFNYSFRAFIYPLWRMVVSIAGNISIVYKNILNKSGPKTEPCSTSANISSRELNVRSISTRCFLFV